jgi:hypothetical protein
VDQWRRVYALTNKEHLAELIAALNGLSSVAVCGIRRLSECAERAKNIHLKRRSGSCWLICAAPTISRICAAERGSRRACLTTGRRSSLKLARSASAAAQSVSGMPAPCSPRRQSSPPARGSAWRRRSSLARGWSGGRGHWRSHRSANSGYCRRGVRG